MKTFKIVISALVLIALVLMVSSHTQVNTLASETESNKPLDTEHKQMVNLFVTHGHCSTPFSGEVTQINVMAPHRNDQGNPLENLILSFEIDPNTFNVCAEEEYTKSIKTPGLFIAKNGANIKFSSTDVYTMGLDWYQINGLLSIKGVERKVKFFASGIRDPKQSNSSLLILEGQFNLSDWGIDYDLIVNGEPNPSPTKWMHLNMKVDLS